MSAVITPAFALFDTDPNSINDWLSDALVLQNGNLLLIGQQFSSTADVQLRIFDPSGAPVGAVQTVNTTTFDTQNDAKVTQLANGNIVVVWTDASETTPDFTGETVRMQIFTQAGVKIGGEITVPTVTAGDQSIETIVALNDGRFAVVWDDFSASSFATAKFRIYNADGTPATAEIIISGILPENREGYVVADGAGGLMVAGIISSGPDRVMLQRYNADGSVNGSAIDVSGPISSLSDAKVDVLSNGSYVVTWTDRSITPPFNKGPVVYGQVVDAAGNKIGGIFSVTDDIFSEHDQSEVTALASGRFAVTWRMYPDNDSLSYKIVTRIFNADGTPDSEMLVVYDNAVNYGTIRNFASLRSVSEMPDGRLLYTFNALTPSSEGITATRIVDPQDGVNLSLTEGADTYTGTIHDDQIRGLGGNDSLYGGVGNDTLAGGSGADLLDGGAGSRDRAQYDAAASAVRADLQSPAGNTGEAAGDVFIGIEDLSGSAFNDILLGDAAANMVLGNLGSDYLEGRGGADTLDGGAGNDTLTGGTGADVLTGGDGARDLASYWTAAAGVRAVLAAPAGNTGDAAGDSYSGIEDLGGSAFNDTLGGDNLANRVFGNNGNDALDGAGGADSLYGEAGNDTLVGGTGADLLDGGAGVRDMASYWTAATGLRAVLIAPGGNTGDAAGDTYAGVEDLGGTAFNDTLGGDTGGNQLLGGNGNDNMDGLAGADTLDGGAGNDLLVGGAGADVLIGGAGTYDGASYWNSGAVRADMAFAATNTGDAAGDSYAGVENLQGSGFADILGGDNFSNTIGALAGNDVIDGRGGNDTLAGEAGADTLVGGAGNDVLVGGAGADVFIFNAALGTANLDVVLDYAVVDDTIWLENAVMTTLAAGALGATAFISGTAATTADHRIIYNATNGQLLYDADGNGAAAAQLIATLNTGLVMTAAEFVVI